MRVTGEDDLARRVLGVDGSLFQADLRSRWTALEEGVRGRRVLVAGGAGSVGSATVALLAELGPAALHVLDPDENGLAELVRDLRSRGCAVPDLRALPLDYGSPLTRRFLREEAPHDIVLSFAAVKHVRSEKDVCSLLRMLDTNLLGLRRFIDAVAERGGAGRLFVVSTDKAADPVGLMGASKRAMEVLLFSGPLADRASSARFANVAFSRGSLLDAFGHRLAKGQPLAAPAATRRFFITLQEAGRICLLGALAVHPGYVLVPPPSAGVPERSLVEVAEAFLRHHGLEPVHCDVEEDARRLADGSPDGRWPLLVTRRDTSGEKAAETFVADGEELLDVGLEALRGIRPRRVGPDVLEDTIGELRRWVDDPAASVAKEDVVDLLRRLVPELDHAETGATLDDRM